MTPHGSKPSASFCCACASRRTQWIQCPNSESAVNMMNMVMDAHMPKDFFDGFVCGDEEYSLNEEAHEMASGRKEIDTQTETKDAPEVDADKEVK